MNRPRWPLVLALWLVALMGTPLPAQEAGTGPDPKLVLGQFDFDPDAEYLELPVTVHGKTYPFVLDTGAAVTVLDTSLKLGKPLGTRQDGPLRLALYKAPPLRVGSIEFRPRRPVVGRPMLDVQLLAWRRLHGLLGLDFLADKVLHIDFDRRKISFLKSVPEGAGEAVRLFPRMDDNRPHVVADIPGWGPETLCVDTGYASPGVALRKDLFDALTTLQGRQTRVVGAGYTLYGVSLSRGGWSEDLRLGKVRLRGLPVGESPFPGSVLGLGALRRFNVTLDFPRATLYLKPNEYSRRQQGWDRYGMRLARRGTTTVVAKVRGDGPAARAGLKEGDAIRQVAGKKAAALSLPELQDLFGADGKAIPVVYWRGTDRGRAVLSPRADPPKKLGTDLSGSGLGKGKNAQLLGGRALAYCYASDFKAALSDLDEAVRLDPESADLRFKRAQVLWQCKDETGALRDYGRAATLDPKNAETVFWRANLHMQRHEVDQAIADYSRAVTLSPKWAFAFGCRANAYFMKRDCDRALADLNQALKLDPTNTQYYVARAEVYLQRPAYREALADYRKALNVDAAYGPALGRLAWLLATCPRVELRDGRQAVGYARKACELTQYRSPADLDTLAAAHAEAGDFAEAIRRQEQALQLQQPGDPHLPEMRERLARYEQARRAAAGGR